MGRYLQDIAAVPGDLPSRASAAADRLGPRQPHRAGRGRPRRRAPAAAHPGHASAGRDRPQRACPPARRGGGSADRRAGPAAHPPGLRSPRRPAVPVRMGPGPLFPAGRAGAAGGTGRARPPDRGPLHRPCPVRQVPGHRRRATRPARRLRVAAGAQHLRAGRAADRPGISRPTGTCCSPSRSTPPCPAPSWTAANRSPRCTTR